MNQTSMYLEPHQNQCQVYTGKLYFAAPLRCCFFCRSFHYLFFISCLSFILFCLVVAYWERAELLADVCIVFSCDLSLSYLVSQIRCGT